MDEETKMRLWTVGHSLPSKSDTSVMARWLLDLESRLKALEEQAVAQSQESSPTTEAPTRDDLLDAVEGLTAAMMSPLLLQPGDLMVADLFHAANCSKCAALLAVTLSRFRTHVLAADGLTSTSPKPDSWRSAAVSGLEDAPSQSPESPESWTPIGFERR